MNESMRPATELIADHPANAALRRHREPRHERRTVAVVAFPDDLPRPYDTLGTHPDLVARLWDELGRALPEDCRVVFFGAPALVHPRSGVVFGFASGTHTYALRLPERERVEAAEAGASRIMRYAAGEARLDLDDIGDEWVFCRWYDAEERWCRAAYEHAGAPLA